MTGIDYVIKYVIFHLFFYSQAHTYFFCLFWKHYKPVLRSGRTGSGEGGPALVRADRADRPWSGPTGQTGPGAGGPLWSGRTAALHRRPIYLSICLGFIYLSAPAGGRGFRIYNHFQTLTSQRITVRTHDMTTQQTTSNIDVLRIFFLPTNKVGLRVQCFLFCTVLISNDMSCYGRACLVVSSPASCASLESATVARLRVFIILVQQCCGFVYQSNGYHDLVGW